MREHEIEADIEARNALRRSAGLPPLGAHESQRLQSVRTKRIQEAAFAAEQLRFKDWIGAGGGLWARATRWSSARRQVAAELKMGKHVHHVLAQLGYRLIEDAWAEGGRRSYVSNEDADRDLLKDLQTLLADYGWTKHPNILRAFINARLVELLEIEIGGRETGGHLLHHLKVAPPRF